VIRRPRTDIVFLHAVLNWATRVRRSDGSPLLVVNPIKGFKAPANRNVRRPLVTYDRYLKIRVKAEAADPQRLFPHFLDVIEGTGWRVSGVCALMASDVDRTKKATAPHGTLHKRGDVDKEGTDAWVPMSESVRAAIDRIRELHLEAGRPVIGDVPLFPSPKAGPDTPAKPRSRWHARDLLERAEKLAELTPLAGGDFHPMRRAWASARKNLPLTDVAVAGGWRDLRSLEKCYTLPDEATILRVVTDPTKIRDLQQAEAGA
jgi:integrase